MGYTIQPIAQQFALSDGSSLADQNQENGLESILDIVRVAEHATAHAQNHRPMSMHESLESGFIPAGEETLQKLSVRHFADLP
jgi:hypothetical protein